MQHDHRSLVHSQPPVVKKEYLLEDDFLSLNDDWKKFSADVDVMKIYWRPAVNAR